MRRTKEESAITREHLLKVALAVFSKKGYLAATLEGIASEAGVTRGAIYWHFKNKAEIYNTLVNDFSMRSETVVEKSVAEGGDFLVILHRIFIRQLAMIEADPELRAFAELRLFKTEQVPELYDGRQQQIRAGAQLIETIAASIRLGIEQGMVRTDLDPRDIARAMIALQNGLIQQWLLAPGSFSLGFSAAALADIFISGIRKP